MPADLTFTAIYLVHAVPTTQWQPWHLSMVPYPNMIIRLQVKSECMSRCLLSFLSWAILGGHCLLCRCVAKVTEARRDAWLRLYGRELDLDNTSGRIMLYPSLPLSDHHLT